jgi:hypothetical protein
MIRRALSPLEAGFFKSPEMIQLALKLLDRADVPLILSNLIHATLGLRLRVDGDNFVAHTNPFDVVSLPESITEAPAACDFMYYHHTPDFTKTLATVGSNSRIVALNCHHSCSDGGWVRTLVDLLPDPAFSKLPRPALPRSFTEIWAREIAQAPPSILQGVSRAWWRRGPSNTDPTAGYFLWRSPVKRPARRFTERLWTGFVIAAAAYNRATTRQFNVITLVDCRPRLPPGVVDLGLVNVFSSVQANADGVDEHSTLRDIGRAMRADFVKQNVYSNIIGDGRRFGSSFLLLSNVGKGVIKKPFEDVWAQQMMPARFTDGLLCLFAFRREQAGKQEYIGRLRWSPRVFAEKEGKALARSIQFISDEMPGGTRADEAVYEVVKLQKSMMA